MPTISRVLSIVVLGAAVIGSAVANAQQSDAPAVSAVNAKLSIEGGIAGAPGISQGAGIGLGSVTVPLGSNFGLQLDGGVAAIYGGWAGGVGGHLFYRDPTRFLIGATGGFATIVDASLGQGGGEAELYLGMITISALGGYQGGGTGNTLRIKSGGYGQLDLKYYLTENLALSGGAANYAGTWMGQGSVEFQPRYEALPGAAVFVNGYGGADNNYRVTAGVRFYFGSSKSLMRRHREDDPASNMFKSAIGAVSRPYPNCGVGTVPMGSTCFVQPGGGGGGGGDGDGGA